MLARESDLERPSRALQYDAWGPRRWEATNWTATGEAAASRVCTPMARGTELGVTTRGKAPWRRPSWCCRWREIAGERTTLQRLCTPERLRSRRIFESLCQDSDDDQSLAQNEEREAT